MKGSLQDIAVIGFILFATSMVLMVLYVALNAFFASAPLQANAVTASLGTTGLNTMVIFGNMFVFLLFGFGLASVISSFYTDTHPVFFIFSIFIFAICVAVVGIFSDTFIEFASTGVLLPVAAEFVLMVDVMTNLPTLMTILGVLILVALYAKRGDLNVGGGQA